MIEDIEFEGYILSKEQNCVKKNWFKSIHIVFIFIENLNRREDIMLHSIKLRKLFKISNSTPSNYLWRSLYVWNGVFLKDYVRTSMTLVANYDILELPKMGVNMVFSNDNSYEIIRFNQKKTLC